MPIDLNSKYQKLTNEIFKNFVFYIPLSIFDKEVFKNLSIDPKLVEDWFNQIIYIDDSLNFINGNNITFAICLLKSGALQNNCFQLMEYKETLSENSFNYLAENYLKQVETYTYISNQLLLHFEKNSPNKDLNTKAIFHYQNFYFNNHLDEINRITGLKPQIFNQETIVEEVTNSKIYKKFSPTFFKKEKSFKDFISHDRNLEIETIILKKYPIIKGKKLRYIIEFFVKKGILTITYGTQTELYHAMKKTFDCNIGTYPSIFGYKVNESKDSDYLRIANELEIILSDYFKTL
ncbi:hypothetical protein [Flavobacterium litorale]|uniref:Uncharacterized protein n=1 Tax=Flavobacterium litorale TaxID=2856519 RepID=A0ABX8V717_9FLAO|nr:hypothetical protein [Flavobacterium litorale]QYJ68282.1 hypothetical protein K1I41_12275 [Flavobacterium litorale]